MPQKKSTSRKIKCYTSYRETRKEIQETKTLLQDQNYCKAQDRCHYTGKYCGTANSICNARYKTPTEIPALFHHGFNYDYHFIIKELAEEF